MGYPLFNVEECIKHLMRLYKKSGYIVNRLPEPNRNILYISWDQMKLLKQKK